MCGIAGIIDLVGRETVPPATAPAMAAALLHRGPDGSGFFHAPGLALAVRRLSIVALTDGHQPTYSEDRGVVAICNGELYDHSEVKADLVRRGHNLQTGGDTEILPHLWEEQHEAMFAGLRGQFALALWDQRRRHLLLARDRFGVCPLYWTRQGRWLLFASEIKALLASGMVKPAVDPRGINHLFSLFGNPGPLTCFTGINALMPGHFLQVQLGEASAAATVTERRYFQLDFPAAGSEDQGESRKDLVDGFEAVMLKAVARRLRADVPVVSYLSGGVDSSLVLAMATKLRGAPVPSFTAATVDPRFDESAKASLFAEAHGSTLTSVRCGRTEVLAYLPRLIQAAEAPVMDTACVAALLLARAVHARGYKVALTGEGADEWLAGYSWHKISRIKAWLDAVPRVPLSPLLERGLRWWSAVPPLDRADSARQRQAVGGSNAWLEFHGLISMAKTWFYSDAMHEQLAGVDPYADLTPNLAGLKSWHPVHRALYFSGKMHLPGLLLNAKGDRAAMASSVETRYPFLDEDVFDFLAPLHPKWKLRGLQDKYLLRLLAERWVPKAVAHRRKAMFRAPIDLFQESALPLYAEQLLSPESLHRTGYFNARAVSHWRLAYSRLPEGSLQRTAVELGLVGVLTTQLWHQHFIDASIAAVPMPPWEATA